MNALANDLSRLGDGARKFLALPHSMFIGGQWCDAGEGRRDELIDPSSGEKVATVPRGGAADADKAVKAARAALTGAWSKLRPHQREALMLTLADLIAAHAPQLAEIESVNSGRLLMNTRLFDVDLSVYVLRYYAGWTTKLEGKTADLSVPYLPDVEFTGYTKREPVGVVVGIVPWNVPLCQAVWKIAPAIAAGCTIVLKPAELTPLTALYLAKLVEKAGFPPGVINVVTGPGKGLGSALVEHPDVDKISFTGSTEVGKQIGAAAGARLRSVSLELGGKSPVLILPDADRESAILGAAWAIFGNHGQNCCAGSRLYVHQSCFDEIVEGVAQVARGIHLGAGLDPQSQMGPLVSRQHQRRVLGYIDRGKSSGAQVVAGGTPVEGPGCYVRPTVMTNTDASMEVVREEIFGPVLVAMPFTTHEQAIALANDSAYGLGASIWTQDFSAINRFVKGFKAGTVWVNNHNVLDVAMPFGGRKSSGVGYDLSEEAVLAHTWLKSVIVRL